MDASVTVLHGCYCTSLKYSVWPYSECLPGLNKTLNPSPWLVGLEYIFKLCSECIPGSNKVIRPYPWSVGLESHVRPCPESLQASNKALYPSPCPYGWYLPSDHAQKGYRTSTKPYTIHISPPLLKIVLCQILLWVF